jgi:uncharacterized protein
MSIWRAAYGGDLAEVERLVGQDPGLLDIKDGRGWTPLMAASVMGHAGVARWLLDKGAVINERDSDRWTALYLACFEGCHPVVRLLVERGADPTLADRWRTTPVMLASSRGHLEVVRLLLGHPSARTTINHRNHEGKTALWGACYWGRGEVAKALLESGADPTIAHHDDTTPMAIAKQNPPPNRDEISSEGRRECVAALEVRLYLLPSPLPHNIRPSDGVAELLRAGRRRSGPTCCGRPGR